MYNSLKQSRDIGKISQNATNCSFLDGACKTSIADRGLVKLWEFSGEIGFVLVDKIRHWRLHYIAVTL